MEEKKSGVDRLSELPDDILHSILRRIKSESKVAQTITLSRRWWILWRSYPVVDYSDEDRIRMKNFKKFGDATVARFSRDSFLAMEALKLSLNEYAYKYRVPVIEQLLDLASERKAQEIDIRSFTTSTSVSFPFRLLFNSATKMLRVTGLRFAYCDDLPLSPNSLRFLHLISVSFKDNLLFENLIASSPLLETLEIGKSFSTKELKVCTHHINLKTLRIVGCSSKKIEIAAPGLQTLRLEDLAPSKVELTAPQLNLLEITYCCLIGLDIQDFSRLLSNSGTKILRMTGGRFAYNKHYDDLPLSMNSLRFLHLSRVSFKDDLLLEKLLASSPLLETLEIKSIPTKRELKVSTHHTHLKTLRISGCSSKAVKLAALGLETLRLEDVYLSRFELTAPQLSLLEITNYYFRDCCFDLAISKLQSLKSLTLNHPCMNGKKLKLKLSGHKLEEFTLRVPRKLEEIEIDAAGTSLVKFLMVCDAYCYLDEIKKCQISNVQLDEVDFGLAIHILKKVTHHWFVALKCLVTRLTQFSTVNIIANDFHNFDTEFEEDEEVECRMPAVDIKHLTIQMGKLSITNHINFLGGLFWALRPRYFTIIQEDCDSCEMLVLDFLTSMKTEHFNWQDQLKDVKTATGDIDRAIKKGVEDAVESISASKTPVTKLTTVSFMLTWH
ncbi:F-box/LRR-repeat protein 13 [Linum grandiflorum]